MPGRGDEGAPIIVCSYDLCAELYQHTNRFPRGQRTLLGRMILDEAPLMLVALTVANRLAEKRESLPGGAGPDTAEPGDASGFPADPARETSAGHVRCKLGPATLDKLR